MSTSQLCFTENTHSPDAKPDCKNAVGGGANNLFDVAVCYYSVMFHCILIFHFPELQRSLYRVNFDLKTYQYACANCSWSSYKNNRWRHPPCAGDELFPSTSVQQVTLSHENSSPKDSQENILTENKPSVSYIIKALKTPLKRWF